MLQHAAIDPTGVEMFLSQRAYLATVPVVFGLRRIESAHRFVQIPEPEEPIGIGQEAARAGMLNDGGLSTRQIADGPVADPAGLQRYVGRFGTTELSPRLLNVRAVVIGGGGNVPGFPN